MSPTSYSEPGAPLELRDARETERLSTFLKVGWWYWDAELDVTVNGTPVRSPVPDNGWDPFLGLGAQYRVWKELSVRAEFERYFLDDQDVDFWSMGLVVKF